MPQPFPRHLKNPNFEIGQAATKRPLLCASGMHVIAQHSQLDAFLGVMFTRFLGADPKPSLAILRTLQKSHLKREALLSVAREVLNEELLDLLTAVLAICEPVEKERNKLAHWLWGIENQIPDKVILIDPKDFDRINTAIIEIKLGDGLKIEDAERLQELIRKSGLLYGQEDFARLSTASSRAFFLVTTLHILLQQGSADPEGAKALKMLMEAPEILDRLQRRRPPRDQ